MRFVALLRKELWESLPWILLAAIIFLAIGGFLLREQALHGRPSWYYSSLSPGTAVEPYQLTHYSHLNMTGSWLLITSIGLGLVLAVRHFWIPHFTRTWPFLLHRSVSRQMILAAKLTAATVAFVVSLGSVWVGLYWYACRPELFKVPPPGSIFFEGWLFIVLGLVAYLGAALVDLSLARWYTTKIFGLAFATIIFFMAIFQWRLSWAFAMVIIGIVVLLSQIIDTFLNREF
ncbi:MAG: hypothetical protein ACYSUY_03765 [Planctomycetota bacterium]|jgi:hypothetical protein